jgi:hypothetical protein
MPKFIKTGGHIRRAWDYLTTHKSDTYQTAKESEDSGMLAPARTDIEGGAEALDEKKERRVTTTTYMMTLTRDGEGDARPALQFRRENHID